MTNSSFENKVGDSGSITFGVMCNSFVFQAWQANCIRQLMRNGMIPKLLIMDDNGQSIKSPWQKTSKYLNRKGLYHLYQRVFFRPQAKEPVDLTEQFEGVETIACKTNRKKFSEYFSDADIKEIKSHKLSFILRFGFNIIRGEILEAARFGVWSFHHDDEQKYRGGPPGFWEIVKNDTVTGVILQRLTNKLDGGIILKKGYFKTITHSYSGQIDSLYFETSSFPLQVCKDILNGQASYFQFPPSYTKATVYKAPSNAVMVNFLLKLIINKLLFHHNEVYQPEDWNVGILSKPVLEVIKNSVPAEITWLPDPPKGHYYADPFGFIRNEKLNIVFENYNYRTRKGIISRVEFIEENFGKIQPAISEKFHLSYPFILESEGQLFCIPETAAINQVRLYKLNQETGKFHFHRTLLEGFPAADPTIFKFGGRWWLFATHQRQSNTKLFAFYSNGLLEPFVPHNNNPIKTDVRSARPAGMPFFKGQDFIRSAQDCSKTYGGRVVLNKILTLNPDEFSEEEVGIIEPAKRSKYKLGLHTLSGTGNFTLIDGKRFKFDGDNFKFMINKKFGKFVG
jgi:hypothetical protein